MADEAARHLRFIAQKNFDRPGAPCWITRDSAAAAARETEHGPNDLHRAIERIGAAVAAPYHAARAAIQPGSLVWVMICQFEMNAMRAGRLI